MAVKQASPVNYYFETKDELINVNEFLGKEFSISYTGNIYCIKCGRKTKKSFSQGFCYPCFLSAPETEECVLRPELCQAHNGIARDMEYAQSHCLIDHFVYLAASESIKVGITRYTQIPIRWIDQGATFAIKIACTPNRYLAGVIETELKKHMTDKTNWRSMLTNKILTNPNFGETISLIYEKLPVELKQYLIHDQEVVKIEYPVQEYPEKVNSIDLDKESTIHNVLIGIKGQYLIFQGGHVINIRKYGGYEVKIKAGN